MLTPPTVSCVATFRILARMACGWIGCLKCISKMVVRRGRMAQRAHLKSY